MVRSEKGQIFDHLRTAAARLRRFAGDIKAGLDALHRVQFDEPWKRDHRLTYEEWQVYIAPRATPPRPMRDVATTFTARPVSR